MSTPANAQPSLTDQPQAMDTNDEARLSPEEQKKRDKMIADAFGGEDNKQQPKAGDATALTLAKNAQLYASPQWVQFQLDQSMAKLYALSGMFGTNTLSVEQSLAQAYVKIQLGRAMGFTEAQAMQGISVVQNKPFVEYPLLGIRLQELGYTWSTAWHKDGRKTNGVTLRLFFKGKPVMQPKFDKDGAPVWKTKNGVVVTDADGNPVQDEEQVSSSFTREDAAQIKFKTSKGEQSLAQRDTYINFPEVMYYAKALRNMQKFHVSNAFAASIAIGRDEVEEAELFRQSDGSFAAVTPGDAHREEAGDRLREMQRQEQGPTQEKPSNVESKPAEEQRPDGGNLFNQQPESTTEEKRGSFGPRPGRR